MQRRRNGLVYAAVSALTGGAVLIGSAIEAAHVEAAPPAKPVGAAAKKAAVAPVNPDAWYGMLQESERQLANWEFQGLYTYVRACQMAEAAHVSFTDSRFEELFAVADECRERFPPSPKNDAVIESVLKWRERCATVVCGAGSPAVLAADESLLAFYMGTGDKVLTRQYLDKLSTKDALSKQAEKRRWQLLGEKLVKAVPSKEDAEAQRRQPMRVLPPG